MVSKKAIVSAVLLCLLASLVGYVAMYPAEFKAKAKAALEWAEKNNGPEAFSAYLLITFIGVVCLVPTTIMELGGGFLFSKTYGVFGTWAATSVAKLFANIISVLIARHLVKDFVQKNLVAKSSLLQAASAAVKEQPLQMAFLVRGSMVPLAVKNYGLGVMDVPYWCIACCACIFTPFYAFQNIYLGSTVSDIASLFGAKKKEKEASAGGVDWNFIFGIACNVTLVFLLVRAIKTQLKKQVDSVNAGLAKKNEDKKGAKEEEKEDKSPKSRARSSSPKGAAKKNR